MIETAIIIPILITVGCLIIMSKLGLFSDENQDPAAMVLMGFIGMPFVFVIVTTWLVYFLIYALLG